MLDVSVSPPQSQRAKSSSYTHTVSHREESDVEDRNIPIPAPTVLSVDQTVMQCSAQDHHLLYFNFLCVRSIAEIISTAQCTQASSMYDLGLWRWESFHPV